MVVARVVLGIALATIGGNEAERRANVLRAEQRVALLEDLRNRLPPRYRDRPVHVVSGDFSPDDTAAEDATHKSCAEVLAEVEQLLAQLEERSPFARGIGNRSFVGIREGVSTQLRVPPPVTLERLRDAGWC